MYFPDAQFVFVLTFVFVFVFVFVFDLYFLHQERMVGFDLRCIFSPHSIETKSSREMKTEYNHCIDWSFDATCMFCVILWRFLLIFTYIYLRFFRCKSIPTIRYLKHLGAYLYISIQLWTAETFYQRCLSLTNQCLVWSMVNGHAFGNVSKITL